MQDAEDSGYGSANAVRGFAVHDGHTPASQWIAEVNSGSLHARTFRRTSDSRRPVSEASALRANAIDGTQVPEVSS